MFCKKCGEPCAVQFDLCYKHRRKTPDERLAIWQSEAYQNRVKELEKEGCTTSDAQGIADLEFKVY